METITIDLPKGFMNASVTLDNYLIADTNDSANWDTFKVLLPKGKWKIKYIETKNSKSTVTLIKKKKWFNLNKMKKIFLIFFLSIILIGCRDESVLHTHEYVIIDTLETLRNSFNMVLSYRVIIKINADSTYHYGRLRPDGNLDYLNVRQLKLK